MGKQLLELRHECIGEEVAGLQPGALLKSVLVALLDGRGTQALRERLHVLADGVVPPRPDNRLRHVASLQAAADLLGEPCALRLSAAQIDAGIDEVAGEAYLWPTFIDLGMALSLRLQDRDHARALSQRRLKAPLGEDVHTLVQLLHAEKSAQADAQSLPELGYLGAQAALSMVGTARAASVLALAAVHGEAALAAALDMQAKRWDAACDGVERGSPQWSIDLQARTLRLTVTVRGKGTLHDCAGWALDDLVYRWPQHLHRLMQREVPVNEVRGAKTRKDIARAIQDGGIEAVADLQGLTLPSGDLAALVTRQDAGLAWIRANHPELADMVAGIRIAGA